ncbi:MAG: hypothetical protein NEHIOOID_01079 [Holosporales bacterium]
MILNHKRTLLACLNWGICILLTGLSLYYTNKADDCKSMNIRLTEQFKAQSSSQKSLDLPPMYFEFFMRKQANKVIKDKDFMRVFERIRRQLSIQNITIKTIQDTPLKEAPNIMKRELIMTMDLDSEDRFYHLMDRLYHHIPGFIMITKFDIKKSKNNRFEGRIECSWLRRKSF